MSRYTKDDLSKQGYERLSKLMAEADALKQKSWLYNLFAKRDLSTVMDEIDDIFYSELHLKAMVYDLENNHDPL